VGRSRVPTNLRLRRGAPREVEVLCRMSPRLSPTHNLEAWCAENGALGAKLLAEHADTEKAPREVTKGSKLKVD
jgi:hypothetical protein